MFESTHIKESHCWKSHAMAQIMIKTFVKSQKTRHTARSCAHKVPATLEGQKDEMPYTMPLDFLRKGGGQLPLH